MPGPSSSAPGAGPFPTGNLAFMFTDIEGSTGLAHALTPDVFGQAISRHHTLIREQVASRLGVEVSTEGDSFFAVFKDEWSAAECALAIQRAVAAEPWPASVTLKVRIGIHVGEAVLGGDNYVGVDVHRAARISHAAHGGQITLSSRMASALQPHLSDSVQITDLGKYRLAGFREAESIFQLTARGLPTEFPPLRGVATVSHLPEQFTSFVGRDQELALGGRLLDENRVLTLTGPGGSGKTRLSIELARAVEARFDDGVHFVSLGSITDTNLISTSALESLGLSTAPSVDPTMHLVDYLIDKRLLIVFDNMEQLLPDATSFVTRILEAATGVKLIITSRAPLKIRGEREIPVPPLAVPGDDTIDPEDVTEYPGVGLFLERAEAVQPGFTVTSQNVGTVVQLANRLEGLPLAIELAASRLRTFTPELILQRMGHRMLESRSPDLPTRQQTIINAIGWSYDLLDEEARLVFERCSVFSGSFDLEQAEQVAGMSTGQIDVLSGLATLVDNSLIQRAEDVGRSRYRMLIVIKEYAYSALAARGDVDTYEQKHSSAFLELAEMASEQMLTSRQKVWLDQLATDHDNLRAAIDRAVNGNDASTALRLVAALWRFWQIRGHLPEASTRTATALALDGGTPVERAKALIAFGGIEYWRGNWEDTLDPLKQAVDLLRDHGTESDIADAVYNLSFPVGYGGDYRTAEALLGEALAIYKEVGDRIGISRAYWGLGNLASYRKDWDTELELMLEATNQLDGKDAPFDLGWAHFMTAFGYQHLGELDSARDHLLVALAIFEDTDDLSALTLIFEFLGFNALKRGDLIKAAKLAGAAERIKEETGIAITEVPVNRFEEYDTLLQSDDLTVRSAFDEGSEMSLEEVLELVRS